MIHKPPVYWLFVVILTLFRVDATVAVVSTDMRAFPAELIEARPPLSAVAWSTNVTAPWVGSPPVKKLQPVKKSVPEWDSARDHGEEAVEVEEAADPVAVFVDDPFEVDVACAVELLPFPPLLPLPDPELSVLAPVTQYTLSLACRLRGVVGLVFGTNTALKATRRSRARPALCLSATWWALSRAYEADRENRDAFVGSGATERISRGIRVNGRVGYMVNWFGVK